MERKKRKKKEMVESEQVINRPENSQFFPEISPGPK